MHPFSIQHIDHIVLRVADLQRSIDFYARVFGAEVVRHNQPLSCRPTPKWFAPCSSATLPMKACSSPP